MSFRQKSGDVPPVSRVERVSGHKKQERLQVTEGIPRLGEMQDGVPILKHTDEGLFLFVKYRNTMYRSPFDRVAKTGKAEEKTDENKIVDWGAGSAAFGDLIFKWGRSPSGLSGENGFNIYFPKSFPNSCFVVVATSDISKETSGQTATYEPQYYDFICQVKDVSHTGFTAYLQDPASHSTQESWNVPVHWIAIGN